MIANIETYSTENNSFRTNESHDLHQVSEPSLYSNHLSHENNLRSSQVGQLTDLSSSLSSFNESADPPRGKFSSSETFQSETEEDSIGSLLDFFKRKESSVSDETVSIIDDNDLSEVLGDTNDTSVLTTSLFSNNYDCGISHEISLAVPNTNSCSGIKRKLDHPYEREVPPKKCQYGGLGPLVPIDTKDNLEAANNISCRGFAMTPMMNCLPTSSSNESNIASTGTSLSLEKLSRNDQDHPYNKAALSFAQSLIQSQWSHQGIQDWEKNTGIAALPIKTMAQSAISRKKLYASFSLEPQLAEIQNIDDELQK